MGNSQSNIYTFGFEIDDFNLKFSVEKPSKISPTSEEKPLTLGPTLTGNVLVLYGHGGLTDLTFNFKREGQYLVNIYAWTREGIAVWDRQIVLVANDALATGTIRNPYATVNSSRIGGTQFKEYVIAPPEGLQLPVIPAEFKRTDLDNIDAFVMHDGEDIEESKRMIFMIRDGCGPQTLSEILYHPSFINKPLDVLWCACKSE